MEALKGSLKGALDNFKKPLKASLNWVLVKGCGSFRKLGGTLFWGPWNKDPTIQGLGSPIFGNSHLT